MNYSQNKSKYLGSDGLKVSDTYNIYLEKCNAFRAKARKHELEKKRCKLSVIQSNSPGYETSEELNKQILKERDNIIREYKDFFNFIKFSKDGDAIYENFVHKSKCIRIIRELSEPEKYEYENEFGTGKSWYLRFHTLRKFVRAARNIILKRRLEKRLIVLRRLTPAMIESFECDKVVHNHKQEDKNNKISGDLMCQKCPAMCGNY